jgi:rSAM/selenodomain-associated transferase 1
MLLVRGEGPDPAGKSRNRSEFFNSAENVDRAAAIARICELTLWRDANSLNRRRADSAILAAGGRMRGVAVGIMCKAPRSGTAKTRLAPLLGEDRAAKLSACFMRDIADTIASLPAVCDAQGYAVFAPKDGEDELRAIMPAGFGFLYQGAKDLGMVLAGAARALFALGHRCVVLVNSDSPTLPPVLIEEAIHQLEAAGDRVVFGPATDGGYYLIGMKSVHQHLFEDVPWSTADVLSRSLERALEIGLPSDLLALWYDVDDAEGLEHLRDELSGRPPPFVTADLRGGAASATRRLLASFHDAEHEGVGFANDVR